jgi:predicted PurR-regulated permease PerM
MNERPTISDVIRRVGVVSWSLLGAALFLGLLVWLFLQVANLLPAIVFATAIIFVFNPVVTRLQERGIPRILGSCLSYLLLGAVLVLIGYLVWPSISDQGRELADRFPEIFDDASSDIEGWVQDRGFSADLPRYEDLEDYFSDNSDSSFISNNLDRIGDITLSIIEFVLLLVFAPVIAFYLLMDLPRLREQALGLIPDHYRGETGYVSSQVGRAVGGFLRGQVVVAIIVGVMTSFGFWLIGLPFWLLIGMIAGFLNIIPFVGPWVGGTLGVLVGLTQEDITTAVWAALVAVIVQQIDNHFISPNVLRATVRMHPATIIFALLVGGTLAGLWGVLLAVPVLASIKIILGHYWRTRVLGQSWEEATEALIDEHPTGELPVVDRFFRAVSTVVDRDDEPEGGGAGPEDGHPPAPGQ